MAGQTDPLYCAACGQEVTPPDPDAGVRFRVRCTDDNAEIIVPTLGDVRRWSEIQTMAGHPHVLEVSAWGRDWRPLMGGD